MENTVLVLKIISIILGVVTGTIIPLIMSKIKDEKTKKNLSKANKVLEFLQKMTQQAEELIVQYEDDNLLEQLAKDLGVSAGSLKKENVLKELRVYALEFDVEFDEEFWEKKIDAIIALTKKVNAD